MDFQMAFVPNVCTVKTYSKNSVQHQSTQIWNELVQRNLNIRIYENGQKTKNLFIEYFLKN